MRRSLASRSLTRELVVRMPNHLSSHLLQSPWREARAALLGRVPRSSFLLLLRVTLFSQTCLFLFRHFSSSFDWSSFYFISFYFPAHEVPSSEISRDDILADSSMPADVVSSGFCTDLVVTGLYAPFSASLVSSCLCYLLIHRFNRLRG
jgi:hypothetical protein